MFSQPSFSPGELLWIVFCLFFCIVAFFALAPPFLEYHLIISHNFFTNKRFNCLMMMMNCFCGTVDRHQVFSLVSSRDHCQRSLPLPICDTPWAGFEPAQNLSSGLFEWSCAVVITTTQQRSHHFFTDGLGISQRVNSPRRPFIAFPLLLGGILKYFGDNFWAWFPILRAVPSPILFHEVLYRCIFYYFASQCVKKNVTAHIPLMWAFCCIWVIFLNVLRNLKHSLDILHGCLDITMVVSKLKNIFSLTQCWTFFGVFSPFFIMFFK